MDTEGSSPLDWRSLLRHDELIAEGRELALKLPQGSAQHSQDGVRKKLTDWAKAQVTAALQNMPRVDSQGVDIQAQEVNDLREPMDHLDQKVTDAQKVLTDYRSGGIPDAPRMPPMRLFLFVGLVLGTIFGLVGVPTIASVLRSIWRPEVADPDTFYMAWGAVLGLLIGWAIGTVTILTRRFAVGAGWLARWAPFFVGLCVALGLSGYRFMQPSELDPSRIVFHLSGIGVVLLFLEVGILIAIETLNHIALNAWEQYQKLEDTYADWIAKEKAAASALAGQQKLLDEAKTRLQREKNHLRNLQQNKFLYEDATTHRGELEEYAMQTALHGFDMGWSERRAGG